MATAKMTYVERNALAKKTAGALAPIPAIPVTPYKPFLAALEASTMGTYGTANDGFDKLFSPLVAAVPQHAAQLAPMDAAIKAASFTPGTIVKTIYSPIGTAIATLAKTGDAQLKVFTGDVTNQTTTNPPAGGGGGGSKPGGGGSGQGGGGGYTDTGGGGGASGGDDGGRGDTYPRFHNLAARIRYTPPTRATLAKGRQTA